MRLAHLSDLHLRGDRPLELRRMLNKRLTGYANLRFRRHAVHKPSVAESLARELVRRGVDHVVVTGDLSNLALEGEFEAGRAFLEGALGLRPDQVSVIPGNHDVYTSGSSRDGRFARYFAPYLQSDLPGYATAQSAGAFPYVHLRGEVAILGLSSAVPRLPFVASGWVGGEQLAALGRLLEDPEVKRRLPVVLCHHPPHNPRSPLRALTTGLQDLAALRRALAGLPRVLVLHGHLHERVHLRLPTRGGLLDAVGATSSSLLHEHPDRMAGFNYYELSATGFAEPVAMVLDPATNLFRERSIPLIAAV